mmetsp:Transcript_28012/g.80974  ORF Transcript_28012/g.80974 Transcript_28012/m.80974 type:complete len:537 (-) Transcript_28012:50-1660(-)
MFRLINVEAGKIGRRAKPPTPTNILRRGDPAPTSTGVSSHLSELDGTEKTWKSNGCRNYGRSLLRWLYCHRLSIAFVSWIGCGTLFYAFVRGVPLANGLPAVGPLNGIEAFYQAVTIGYSVGLAPRNEVYQPNPWFSSAYILAGATLIAVILTNMGEKVGDAAALHLFEDLKQREQYEQNMSSDNPIWTRAKAFFQYNAGYLITIIGWLLWMVFIICWSIVSSRKHETLGETHAWSFASAQYFAISLCSSAGSFSLPPDSPLWAYLLAGISMAIGVPLMALAISSIVIMWIQGSKFNQVKKAAWTPVTQVELENLMKIGLGHSEEVISRGDYVLLGLLRMGTDAGMIKYLCDCYDQAEEEAGCVCLDETVESDGKTNSSSNAGGGYSEQARAYLSATEPDNKLIMPAGRSRALLARCSQRQVSGNRVSIAELSDAMASFSQSVQTSPSHSGMHSMKNTRSRRDVMWSVRGNKDGSRLNMAVSGRLNDSPRNMGADSPLSFQASTAQGLATLEEAPEEHGEDAGGDSSSSDSCCRST